MAESRIAMSGEVDIRSAGGFRSSVFDALAAHPDRDLVVDCAELSFVDSSAVRVLLQARQALVARGHGLRMVNLPNGPRRTLDRFGLTDVLGID